MIFLVIAAAVVIADQALKLYALNNLAGIGEVRLIPYVIHLMFSKNDGASLGIFAGQRWLLIACSSVASVALIYAILGKRLKLPRSEKYCLAFVLGGAVGNLIDRVFSNGEVVDMLYFPWIGKIPLLPEFICNIADIAVVFGAAAFVILYALREFRKPRNAENG